MSIGGEIMGEQNTSAAPIQRARFVVSYFDQPGDPMSIHTQMFHVTATDHVLWLLKRFIENAPMVEDVEFEAVDVRESLLQEPVVLGGKR